MSQTHKAKSTTKNVSNEQMDYPAKASPWHLVSFTHASKDKGTSYILPRILIKTQNT